MRGLAAQKRAATVSGLPADVSAGLDALVARVQGMLGTAKRVAVLGGMPRFAKALARGSADRV